MHSPSRSLLFQITDAVHTEFNIATSDKIVISFGLCAYDDVALSFAKLKARPVGHHSMDLLPRDVIDVVYLDRSCATENRDVVESQRVGVWTWRRGAGTGGARGALGVCAH